MKSFGFKKIRNVKDRVVWTFRYKQIDKKLFNTVGIKTRKNCEKNDEIVEAIFRLRNALDSDKKSKIRKSGSFLDKEIIIDIANVCIDICEWNIFFRFIQMVDNDFVCNGISGWREELLKKAANKCMGNDDVDILKKVINSGDSNIIRSAIEKNISEFSDNSCTEFILRTLTPKNKLATG